jgi:hypothetical protein
MNERHIWGDVCNSKIYQTLEGEESTFGEILAANTSRMRVSHI